MLYCWTLGRLSREVCYPLALRPCHADAKHYGALSDQGESVSRGMLPQALRSCHAGALAIRSVVDNNAALRCACRDTECVNVALLPLSGRPPQPTSFLVNIAHSQTPLGKYISTPSAEQVAHHLISWLQILWKTSKEPQSSGSLMQNGTDTASRPSVSIKAPDSTDTTSAQLSSPEATPEEGQDRAAQSRVDSRGRHIPLGGYEPCHAPSP